MESPEPQKIGEATELFSRRFGKTALVQKFFNPRSAREEEYLMFDFAGIPVVVLALTPDQNVITIRQFRYAANTTITELPGGAGEAEERPEETARQELEEETGFVPGKVRRLTERPIWFDPATFTTPFWPCLAENCVPSTNAQPKTDEHDKYLEVSTIPLAEWTECVRRGKILDAKTIVTTFLALPHLER